MIALGADRVTPSYSAPAPPAAIVTRASVFAAIPTAAVAAPFPSVVTITPPGPKNERREVGSGTFARTFHAERCARWLRAKRAQSAHSLRWRFSGFRSERARR